MSYARIFMIFAAFTAKSSLLDSVSIMSATGSV